MNSTGTCPKCKGRDVVRIPGEVGAYGTGNNIQVGWTIFSSVKVTRFLCAGCGFTEEWIEGSEDVRSLKAKFKPAP